jgi:hypothetical protein
MECSCFSTDNDDFVTMLASNKRRAVKIHRCSECLGTIFPGQTYLDERYLYDGDVSTHKTCACCESVREHLFCQFAYSELWSDLGDLLRDGIHYDLDGAPWAKIAKLTPDARAHVLLMIEEIWADAMEDEDDE